MVNISDIKEKARLLNLQNIANGIIDITNYSEGNLKFLNEIFEQELSIRKNNKIIRFLKASEIPKSNFIFNELPKVLIWQIERLLEFDFIENSENLFLIGKCNTGKTSLAAYIGRKAIEKGYKGVYIKTDELLSNNKKTQILNDMDLIIIDDIMYMPLTDEQLQFFYRKLIFLNESRSIIFITNRELSEWIEVSSDKHLMQTMLSRLLLNSQTLRLGD
jgi:DNA replication protein DnaC